MFSCLKTAREGAPPRVRPVVLGGAGLQAQQPGLPSSMPQQLTAPSPQGSMQQMFARPPQGLPQLPFGAQFPVQPGMQVQPATLLTRADFGAPFN